MDSGFFAEAGPLARIIFLELQQSRMHAGPWSRQYMAAIKAREITVADSVEAYLQAL